LEVPENRETYEEDGQTPNRESNASESGSHMDFGDPEAGMWEIVFHAAASTSRLSNNPTSSAKLKM